MKATPVKDTVLAAGLVRVNVRLVVPSNGIVGAPNALAIAGGATTMRVAEAVRPVPPSVEVTALVTLFMVPAAVPVTFTEMVHEVLDSRVAPDRLTTPPDAVIVPLHGPGSILGLARGPADGATPNPDGSVSLNPMPVKLSAAFGLLTVNTSVVVPFSGMLGAPNALESVGGCGAEVTSTSPDVAVILEYTVSVAVMVWFPAVSKVTGKSPVPLVSVELAGRIAEPSVLVKCSKSL